MEQISLDALLKEEEEKLRTSLRADNTVDHNRQQSVSRLQDAFRHVLLRYNAAHSGNGMRQAVADSVAAPAMDMAELLLSGTAEKEISKRPLRSGAVIALLAAVVCCLAGILLLPTSQIAGIILMAGASAAAYCAGRLWYGEREVRVRSGLDAASVWKTADRAVSTMDRKIEELCSLIEQWEAEAQGAHSTSDHLPDTELLKLLSDLLEALYSESGEYAMQQLKKIRPYLRSRGIDMVDYAPDCAEDFELLPTKLSPATLRPALKQDGKLLVPGRATEQVMQNRRTGV